ncbi:MAG TPA: glycosyltransferase [Steroidobacter sp.]|uniref:glycosyltransferase n=1 Tax=Steroidobacter sp. TaxID=1978227 RepID=UPI002ED99A58
MSPAITLFLPSVEGGGAERVFVQLANEFAKLGCRVEFVLARARGPYLEEISEQVRIVDLRASGVLNCLPALVRYLRSRRPAAILSGLEHANVIAVLARSLAGRSTRCVVSTRAVPTAIYRANRSRRRWMTLQMSRLTYRLADQVIANSQAVAADLAGSLGVSNGKLTVIYNPLDMEYIDRNSRMAADHPWLTPGSAPVVLSVGSLTVLKDFQTLIRAFAIVRSARECRLIILGEGPERAKLESMVEQLNLRNDVCLPGFVGNPFAWMRCAGVFVSSSLTEGCPNALMQALACGTAVVSTDCNGGSAEILQAGKWGHLVPVGDAEAMAAAITAALDSPRPNGRQRANDFALHEIAQQYLHALLPSHLPALTRGPA